MNSSTNEGGIPFTDKGSTHTTAPTEPTSETGGSKMHSDFKTAASTTAEQYRGKADQVWEDTQERARVFHREIEQEVRQNPTKAIFSAVGIGFLIALILKR